MIVFSNIEVSMARTDCAILVRHVVRHPRDQLVAPLIAFGVAGFRIAATRQHGQSAQSAFQVILHRIKASADRIKTIHGHFYPIADHLNPIADGFYPTADRLKVIADGKKVIWVGFK